MLVLVVIIVRELVVVALLVGKRRVLGVAVKGGSEKRKRGGMSSEVGWHEVGWHEVVAARWVSVRADVPEQSRPQLEERELIVQRMLWALERGVVRAQQPNESHEREDGGEHRGVADEELPEDEGEGAHKWPSPEEKVESNHGDPGDRSPAERKEKSYTRET